MTVSQPAGLSQPVVPDGLVCVRLFRDVPAGQELILQVREAAETCSAESNGTDTVTSATALSFLSAARIAPRPLSSIAYLPPMDSVPVEIVKLGMERWMQVRRSAAQVARPMHRDALDEALVDMQMEVEMQLSDGARTEIQQYQQARRQASREAAAAHNGHMEGERRCELLKVLLAAVADPTKRTQGV